MYRASFAAGPDSESPTGGTGTGPTVTNSLVGDGQSGAPTSAVLTTVVTTNTEGEVVPVATKVGEVEGDGDGQGEEGETNSTSGTESAPRVMGLIAVFMVGLFYYW